MASPRPVRARLLSSAQRIRTEQLEVDLALAAGVTHLVNSPTGEPRVHTVDCVHVRHLMVRAEGWAPYLEQARRRQRDSAEHDRCLTGPRMPVLLTRAQVERLNAYRACQVCAPSTDHAVKNRGERTIQARNLGARYVGKSLELTDGTALGILQGIALHSGARGGAVTLQTSSGAHELPGLTALFATRT